jgi:hypothetical protein
MFSLTGQGGEPAVRLDLLQQAAASGSAGDRHQYLRHCMEEGAATLLSGLGNFDSETLCGPEKQHFSDLVEVLKTAGLENANLLLETERRARLWGATAAIGRAVPAATIVVETNRYQIVVDNNAAIAAATAAVPAVLQHVPLPDSNAQLQLIQELATLTARAARGPLGEDTPSARAIRAAAAEAESEARAMAQGTNRRQLMIISKLGLRLLAIVESKRCHNPAVGNELRRIGAEEFSRAELNETLTVPDAFDRARVTAAYTASSAVSLATPVTPSKPKQSRNYRRSNDSFQDWSSGGNNNSNNSNTKNNNRKRPNEGGGGGGRKRKQGDR